MEINIGEQILPFRDYLCDKSPVKNLKANVIFVANEPQVRMCVIICEKNGQYQDFYYNEHEGCFKPLSESYEDSKMSPSEWWKEEYISTKCPDFFTSCMGYKFVELLK